MTAEQLAEKFHNLYEQLAPEHGYETRKESAKPWADVPAKNKGLMIDVCKHLLATCQELSIKELTERFYKVKGQRDRLVDALRAISNSNTTEGVKNIAIAAMQEIDPKNDYSSCTGVGPVAPRNFAGTAQPMACANCGEESTNPGQFVRDGRWVCCNECRKNLADAQSYDDLAASGGIVDAP